MSEYQPGPGFEFPITGEYRRCPHGFHHPPWSHSCDGCWCEGERDRRDYGWDHDTSPRAQELRRHLLATGYTASGPTPTTEHRRNPVS